MTGVWLYAASLLLLINDIDAQNNCFTMYSNSLILGGVLVNANNLQDCQNYCLASPGCAGVDWDRNTNRCYRLQKQTDRKPAENGGVDHYDNFCSYQSSTLTTLPGIGGGGCSFSPPYTNSNIIGGMVNPALSDSACKDACTRNSSCQGIDWSISNLPGQQCFLLNTTNGRNSNIANVTHYDYICNGSNQTTMMPPPRPPSRVCVPTYEGTYETSSINGINVPVPLLACPAACQRIGTCLGVDMNPFTGCWFHYNVTSFPRKYYQQFVTQFKINRCPEEGISNCIPLYNNGVVVNACNTVCYPRFTRWMDTAGTGGTMVNLGDGNVTACLAYCFQNIPSCVGVDFSQQPGSPSVCTYYTQTPALTNTVMRPYVTQYRLEDRCTPNCATTFESRENFRYRLYNPSIAPNVVTQTDCLNSCRASPTCEAYQFTKSGPGSPSCTLADNFYEFSAVNDSSVYTGLYRENCNRTELPPTPPMPGGGCSFSQAYPNTNILGGMANPASSEFDCRAACMNTSGCQGIDWDPGNPSPGQRCFLLNTMNGKRVNMSSGVTHYDYICNGSMGGSTTLPVPGSGCSFSQAYPNTNILGGMANPATSEFNCKTACMNTSGCQGIDWDPGNTSPGRQCFLLNTTNGKNVGTSPNVTHYDYICNGSMGGSTTLPGNVPSSTTIPTAQCWNKFINTLIYGGAQNSAATLDACQTSCTAQGRANCISVDWSYNNTVGSQCFLHNTAAGKMMQPNIDHYDYIC